MDGVEYLRLTEACHKSTFARKILLLFISFEESEREQSLNDDEVASVATSRQESVFGKDF